MLDAVANPSPAQQPPSPLAGGQADLPQDMFGDVLKHMQNGVAYCRMLFEASVPRDFVYVYTNPAFHTLTGLGPVLGKPVSEVIPGIQAADPHLFEIYGRVAAGGAAEKLETYVAALQQWFAIEVFCPRPEHFIAVFDVISERKKTQEALQASERRYRSAFETSLDSINITRLSDGQYVDVNDAFLQLMGYRRDEVVGRTSIELNIWADPADRSFLIDILQRDTRCQNQEFRFCKKSGEIVWGLMSASIMELDGERCLLSVTRNISDLKAAEDEIRNLAFYDPLTRLPNRRLLRDRLEQALTSSVRHQRHGALLLLDLDDFKTLNDTLGHDVGDQFLIEVARRLSACVREGDTVARQGGDEFVVILEDLSADAFAAAQAESVATKILRTIGQPYQLDLSTAGVAVKRNHHCTVSIGITLFRDHDTSVEELMKRADTAMYRAKAAGHNTLRFFDPAMQAAVSARAALDHDLREAVQAEQFLLYYQPQIGEDGRMTGAEALVRWRHPQRGLIPPSDFIALTEDNGLILPLGHWVLERACAQLVAWAQRPATAHLTLAVNVSARQFRQPNFVATVLAILIQSGADPRKLKLELTESVLLDNVEDIIDKMNLLQAKGISFSLDDFGTGYSSLAYLKRLPLDQLKIDRSFVRDVLSDPNDAAIAKTIVALGQSLGLGVIAEGVETEAQRDFLASHGCLAYQGYLFSPPVPLHEFEGLVLQA
jgi:diguanylate cyclase (GGDEF)-like protein/PAS domain S-box-containing protein